MSTDLHSMTVRDLYEATNTLVVAERVFALQMLVAGADQGRAPFTSWASRLARMMRAEAQCVVDEIGKRRPADEDELGVQADAIKIVAATGVADRTPTLPPREPGFPSIEVLVEAKMEELGELLNTYGRGHFRALVEPNKSTTARCELQSMRREPPTAVEQSTPLDAAALAEWAEDLLSEVTAIDHMARLLTGDLEFSLDVSRSRHVDPNGIVLLFQRDSIDATMWLTSALYERVRDIRKTILAKINELGSIGIWVDGRAA